MSEIYILTVLKQTLRGISLIITLITFVNDVALENAPICEFKLSLLMNQEQL